MLQVFAVSLLHALVLFSMGVAMLARLLPLSKEKGQIRLFLPVGLFGLTHGIFECLVALHYLLGSLNSFWEIGTHLVGLLSFVILLTVPLFALLRPKMSFFLIAAIMVGLLLVLFFTLKKSFSLFAEISYFETWYRWLLGLPAVLGTTAVLWSQYHWAAAHSKTRWGFLLAAFFFLLYAILTTFSEPSYLFPSTVWNSARFYQVIGLPVPLLRALAALGIMVALLYTLYQRQEEELASLYSQAKELKRRAVTNEKMLSSLMSNIPGMVYRCLNDENWTMLYVSDGALQLTGYHPTRFLSGVVLFNQLIHPEDRSLVRQTVDFSLSRHKPYTLKYRILDSSGQEKWVWEQGRAVWLPEIGMILEGFIYDITAMQQAQAAIEASEQKYRQLIELAQAGVWSVNAEGITDYVNHRMATILGREPRDILGHKFSEFVVAKPELHDWTLQQEWLQGKTFHRVEYELKNALGESVYALFEVSTIKDQQGNFAGAIAFVIDITEQKRSQQKLRYIAEHDSLTGLYNRHYLFEYLRQLQESKNPSPFALLFIDFDRFKQVNDMFGHYVGDILLTEAAVRIRSQVRPTDVIARVGGDEFAIVLHSITDPAQVAVFASRLIDLFQREFIVEKEKLYCSLSIGIAFFPRDAENVVQLVRHAARAMYWSKSLGKNNFQFFAPEMSQDSQSRHAIELELRKSLSQNTLEVLYQPQIDVKAWTIRGLEALSRLRDSNSGEYIPPDRFISIAEESQLIHQLGRYVLEKALADLQTLQQAGFPELTMSINVSARQLQAGHLIEDLSYLLEKTKVAPRLLELEITETTAMANPENAEKILRKLQNLGIRIAIDDFGTGYSSLAYLQRFPVTHLKVDRIFVRNLPDSYDNAAIVRSMINLGHSLNMTVTAEGVESLAQLKFLRDAGCDFVQGFYFSPALPLTKLISFLQEPFIAGNKAENV